MGGTGNGGFGATALIEHWNGTTWTRQTPAPTSRNVADILDSVACINASDCTAVGISETNPGGLALVEHWNGSSWSKRNAPTPSGRDSSLNSVACIASNNCWAVGSSFDSSGNERRLAEHWNGSSWSIIVTPAPGTFSTAFRSIACAEGQCVAVGATDQQPLVDRWDGAQWTTETVSPLTNRGEFDGVTCISARTCVAVGEDFNGNTVVERSR